MRLVNCAAFIAAVLVPPAAAQSPEEAIKHVTDGVGGLLGSIFNPTETEFRAAVGANRMAQALSIIERNLENLSANRELTAQVQAVLAYARTVHGPDYRSQIVRLRDATQNRAFLNDLQSFSALLADTSRAETQYLNRSLLLRRFQDTDPILVEGRGAFQAADEALKTNVAEIYTEFPHESRAFSEVYPQGANEVELFKASAPKLLARFERLDSAARKRFAKNTSAAWQGESAIRSELVQALFKKEAEPSLLGRMRFSKQLTEYGFTPFDFTARPKVYGLNASANKDVPVQFLGSLDGTRTTIQEAVQASEASEPFLLVTVTEVNSRRTIVDKKEIESRYKSGTRLVPNPSYAIAQMDCQRAQNELAAKQARNTIAPARGWGALLQGVAEGLSAANVREVCNRFAATPAATEEDVFTSYTYNVAEIELVRELKGRLLGIEQFGREVEEYPLTLEDKHRVQVAYGKKTDDRGPADNYINDNDLERLSTKPLVLNIDHVLTGSVPSARTHPRADFLALISPQAPLRSAAALIGPNAGTGPSSAAGVQQVAAQASWAPSSEASADGRMSSVVVVLNPKGAIGAGFYVDNRDILTNYHVVEGSSTVELRSIDGTLFTGRVIRRDIGTDLALVRVEREGPPVQFAHGILKAGETVEAIGHPKGLFFSVSRGIVSAVRQMKGLLAQGGDRALLIQTDAAINPGNSGGPLFLKDKVVGMNTVKFKGADGIGFAVHFSELIKFLSQ